MCKDSLSGVFSRGPTTCSDVSFIFCFFCKIGKVFIQLLFVCFLCLHYFFSTSSIVVCSISLLLSIFVLMSSLHHPVVTAGVALIDYTSTSWIMCLWWEYIFGLIIWAFPCLFAFLSLLEESVHQIKYFPF